MSGDPERALESADLAEAMAGENGQLVKAGAHCRPRAGVRGHGPPGRGPRSYVDAVHALSGAGADRERRSCGSS